MSALINAVERTDSRKRYRNLYTLILKMSLEHVTCEQMSEQAMAIVHSSSSLNVYFLSFSIAIFYAVKKSAKIYIFVLDFGFEHELLLTQWLRSSCLHCCHLFDLEYVWIAQYIHSICLFCTVLCCSHSAVEIHELWQAYKKH